MDLVQTLRVVVASPNDVKSERESVPKIAEELNRGIAADRNLRLEVFRWETDAYPGFHPKGPQGLVDTVLRIEECDLLIGIFWKRFGTPTTDADSGTAHEFKLAYEAWKHRQHPHIMFYFNQKAHNPKSQAEIDQVSRVLKFKQEFPDEGLWWAYSGKTQFESLVRQHLTLYLREHFQVVLRDQTHFGTSPHGAQRLPGIGRDTAQHWIANIVTPLISEFRTERELLEQRKWGFQFYNKKLLYITTLLPTASDGLFHFTKHHRDLKTQMELHDQQQKELEDACQDLHEAIMETAELAQLYDLIKADDTNGPTGEGINRDCRTYKPEHPKILAQYIVNRDGELHAQTFDAAWNKYKDKFLELLDLPTVSPKTARADQAGMSLLKTVQGLIDSLLETRERLSAAYDVPFY